MRPSKLIGLVVVWLSLIEICGCSGILWQKVYPGGAERLRVQSPSRWSNWDRNGTKQDDACVLLESESNF